MNLEELREKLEELDFRIIAAVGTARSMYMEALNQAKSGDHEAAKATIEEADALFAQGHDAHHDILAMQGQGIELPFDLMLVHAEDQMMSAECFRLMATELIQLYAKLEK